MAKQSASTDLSKLDPNKLPEIQGFKETLLKLVEENPYVAIEDNSTYETAKKHRTALRTGRTTLQSQEKLVVKKINEFKNKVKDATAELIQITLPHEEKQQAEVSRYEEIKEQERLERERIEEERIQGHKEDIARFKSEWENRVDILVYENAISLKSEFVKEIANLDLGTFEEFETEMQTTIALVEDKMDSRIKHLNQQEEQRQEALRLQKERQEQERIQKIQEEERLALQKERELLDTERRENLYIKRINALDKIDYFTFYEQFENFKDEILDMDEDAFEVFVKESHDSILKGMEVDAEVVADGVEVNNNVDFQVSEDKDFVFPDDLGSGPEEKYSQVKHLIEYLNLNPFHKDFVVEIGVESEELMSIYTDFLKKFESLKKRTIKKIQEYDQNIN